MKRHVRDERGTGGVEAGAAVTALMLMLFLVVGAFGYRGPRETSKQPHESEHGPPARPTTQPLVPRLRKLWWLMHWPTEVSRVRAWP